MNFLKNVIKHPEVKRGASHVLVGLAIAVVSTLVFKDGVQPPAQR